MFGVNNQNSFRLFVVTAISFPIGMAAANRIISYSKGLVELGNEVMVLTLNSHQNFEDNCYLGIKFKGFEFFSNFRRFKIINIFLSLISLMIYFSKNVRNNDKVIIVSNSLYLNFLLYIISKFIGFKIVQEKSEFPFVLLKTSIIEKIYAKFYVSFIYKLFDGMIIMTHPLLDYFKDKTKKKCKKILIPMTVEPERFTRKFKKNNYGEYLAYCGYMGGNKDGVENLIHSFSLVKAKHPNLKLLLIGDANHNEMSILKNLVDKLSVNDIIFVGKVSRDEIPKLLCQAKILVLARPSSMQSNGGFPTKLGEYLSTGKPVLVTKVGDIPNFLSNNQNAFLVEPDNNVIFADKIHYILTNYNQSLNVAKEGMKLVYNVFNYKVQSKKINDFLIEL